MNLAYVLRTEGIELANDVIRLDLRLSWAWAYLESNSRGLVVDY